MFIDESLVSKRPLVDVEYIVIHHSDAPRTLDITEIAKEEKIAQNFVTVGYHEYLKYQDGAWVMQSGRAINDIPAAAYGLNENSYDICMGGNYHPQGDVMPLDVVDPDAITMIVDQINVAKAKLPNLKYLIGHRDVATIKAKHGGNPGDYSTACPGDELYKFMHELRVRTGLASPPEIL